MCVFLTCCVESGFYLRLAMFSGGANLYPAKFVILYFIFCTIYLLFCVIWSYRIVSKIYFVFELTGYTAFFFDVYLNNIA